MRAYNLKNSICPSQIYKILTIREYSKNKTLKKIRIVISVYTFTISSSILSLATLLFHESSISVICYFMALVQFSLYLLFYQNHHTP